MPKRQIYSNNYYLFGLAAAVVYVLTIIIGGELWPGYTIYQAISELTLPTSPHRVPIIFSLVLFNILLLIHGIVIGKNLSHNRWFSFSSAVYAMTAVAGLLMASFPMDAPHTVFTSSGFIHRWMATNAIVGTVIIVFSSTIAFYQLKELRPLARLSLLFGIAVALTALGVWISALRLSLAFGSFQKSSLGLFMIWLGWTSLELRRRSSMLR
ncbi:MAG: DUF998 domain-containing protein [bacterium]|nr:DUF998 domain-containing protein [bacterium]